MDSLCYDQGTKLPYKVIGGEPVLISYSADEVFAKIKHDQIKFIDLQFTGLLGRFHHNFCQLVYSAADARWFAKT
jgi:glutamine synthetase